MDSDQVFDHRKFDGGALQGHTIAMLAAAPAAPTQAKPTNGEG